MLTDIRDFLRKNQGASLNEIARHFRAEPALVESMLDRWILKGRVVAERDLTGGGCCGKCGGHSHIRYRWVD